MALKLNKANAMLSKLRHGLGTKTLKPVYYAVFESMLHLFRYKTLINLKGFTYYTKHPSE